MTINDIALKEMEEHPDDAALKFMYADLLSDQGEEKLAAGYRWAAENGKYPQPINRRDYSRYGPPLYWGWTRADQKEKPVRLDHSILPLAMSLWFDTVAHPWIRTSFAEAMQALANGLFATGVLK